MSTSSDILRSVFSREDDNSYEEREDNKPENGESVVTSKGDDSDNGPKEQEVQSVQKDGKDVDQAFNEEHTDSNPASVEDLDDENIPTEEEVEQMSEEIPEAPEEGDAGMTEDGPEVENPPSVEETPESETPPVDPETVAPTSDDEGTGNITDPENKEAGIDPVQALECILYSREEDIQIIKDGVQICIDEENKVQIDQNASTNEGGESSSENTEGSEGEENTEGAEGSEGGESGSEGGENTEGEENSTESMSLKRIADYFC